ncbi:GemA protein [candidate division KSB3 bacterium]|uniref:GemA protein n=1 Tax=candidate division KSB3 bacterium TaxID=2044937 RepID=A0A2G6EB65_9BACT|nr:MAG: GemA protein [candidate division KSB3 bacterium]
MPPTRAEYAKINIACKELGIDKKDLLADMFGLESSKQLTRTQTFKLLEHLKRLGFKPKRGKKTSPSYTNGQMRKIVALWITLAQAGVVKNSSDRALQAYIKRMTKKDNLAWCDGKDLSIVIESLKRWATREDVDVDN